MNDARAATAIDKSLDWLEKALARARNQRNWPLYLHITEAVETTAKLMLIAGDPDD